MRIHDETLYALLLHLGKHLVEHSVPSRQRLVAQGPGIGTLVELQIADALLGNDLVVEQVSLVGHQRICIRWLQSLQLLFRLLLCLQLLKVYDIGVLVTQVAQCLDKQFHECRITSACVTCLHEFCLAAKEFVTTFLLYIVGVCVGKHVNEEHRITLIFVAFHVSLVRMKYRVAEHLKLTDVLSHHLYAAYNGSYYNNNSFHFSLLFNMINSASAPSLPYSLTRMNFSQQAMP